MTVTCLQFPEALASIFLKGLVIADTLREKKPLYPIDVTDTFHHQRFSLPADPPPVFLFMGKEMARTIAHTRGSFLLKASRTRSSASPSTRVAGGEA